jgi:hypothetical protein
LYLQITFLVRTAIHRADGFDSKVDDDDTLSAKSKKA